MTEERRERLRFLLRQQHCNHSRIRVVYHIDKNRLWGAHIECADCFKITITPTIIDLIGVQIPPMIQFSRIRYNQKSLTFTVTSDTS